MCAQQCGMQGGWALTSNQKDVSVIFDSFQLFVFNRGYYLGSISKEHCAREERKE